MDRKSLIGLNHFVNKEGIVVIEAQTPQKANEITSEILEKYCDFKTALFLSGGKTPKKLYEYLASQKSLKVGSVGMIDERFGENLPAGRQGLHKNSNELMIKNTGLLTYFENQNIRFYGVLTEEESLEDTSRQYDEALRFVTKYFPKTVGVLGIGSDSHTAGLPSGNQKSNLISQKAKEIIERINNDQSSLVSFYELEGYGKRITMNFNALSMLDLIIVLVLGQEKREALRLMFEDGPIEEVPSRFYLQPKIAEKVILITDQIV